MDNKMDMISPEVHPDAGMKVTLHLLNKSTGRVSKKVGMWDRSYWAVIDKKTGAVSSVPSNFEFVGWSE